MALNVRGLKTSRQLVLYYLIKLENDKTGYAWPSITAICWATQLQRSSVKESIRDLQKQGLITRELREGSGRRDRMSRATFIVWPRVVTMQRPKTERVAYMAGQAKEKAAEAIKSRRAQKTENAGASPTAPKSKKAKFAPLPAADLALYGRHLDLLHQTFPDHSTFENPDADRMLVSNLRKCTLIAGSEEKCFEVIEYILLDPLQTQIRENLNGAHKLGGYIASQFSNWLEALGTWGGHFEGGLDTLRKGIPVRVDFVDAPFLNAFKFWVTHKAGEHLISQAESIGESELSLTMVLSPDFYLERAYATDPEPEGEENPTDFEALNIQDL
jgi:cellobiose-specific phosphotransferase system component IIA